MRILAALLIAAGALQASTGPERLESAAETLTEIMGASDRGIPQDLLNRAQCLAVVPGLKKGAFIVGAKYGRGFFSCRKQGGVGWSAPAAIRMEGGSVGFQLGVSETDVIMLILNRKGADKLLSSKFTLGGEGSVAAGPVGRTSTAETDALMRAEILSWSRTRGAFAGISLKGATLRPDVDTNQELYGKPLTNREIVNGSVAAPKSAAKLMGLLNKYSSRR